MVMTLTSLARLVFPALFGAALAGGAPLPVAHAAEPISAQDAHSIGVTAYLALARVLSKPLRSKGTVWWRWRATPGPTPATTATLSFAIFFPL